MNKDKIGYQQCSKGHTMWLGRPMRNCPVPGCEGSGDDDGLAGVREPRRPAPTEGLMGSELPRKSPGTVALEDV